MPIWPLPVGQQTVRHFAAANATLLPRQASEHVDWGPLPYEAYVGFALRVPVVEGWVDLLGLVTPSPSAAGSWTPSDLAVLPARCDPGHPRVLALQSAAAAWWKCVALGVKPTGRRLGTTKVSAEDVDQARRELEVEYRQLYEDAEIESPVATNKDVAAHLGVSMSTVIRRRRELRAH
jgi:hypothetical protein